MRQGLGAGAKGLSDCATIKRGLVLLAVNQTGFEHDRRQPCPVERGQSFALSASLFCAGVMRASTNSQRADLRVRE